MDNIVNMYSKMYSSVNMDSTANQDPEKPCRLLELPAEIRNRIFHYAVVHTAVLEVGSRAESVEHIGEWDKDKYTCAPFRLAEPSLPRVCRQIRAETLSVFYGCNIFRASLFNLGCGGFISKLPPEKRTMLRQVRIFYRMDRNREKDRLCGKWAENRLKGVEWTLRDIGLGVPEGSLYVAVQVTEHERIWTNEPGECKICERCPWTDEEGASTKAAQS